MGSKGRGPTHFLRFLSSIYNRAVFAGFLLGLFTFGGAEVSRAQTGGELIIFSDLHGTKSTAKTEKRTGQIRLQVSGFETITKVAVNKVPQKMAEPSSFVDFVVPFEITGEQTHFLIEVQTAQGTVQKDFTLVFAKKTEPKKAGTGFQGVVILAGETTDNLTATKVKKNKVKAKKTVLTLVPSYRYNEAFKFSGVFLREKYSKAKNDPFGIVYSQLKVDYELKFDWANLKFELGANDIKTQLKGLSGKTQIEKDGFFGVGVSLGQWDFKAKYTKIKQPVPKVATYHGSGGNLTGSLATKMKFGPLVQTYTAESQKIDALGKYQDRSSNQLRVNSNYDLTKQFQLQLKLSAKKTTYAILDPLKSVAEASTMSSGSLGLSYRFMPTLIFTATGKAQKQTSNVTAKVYSSNHANLSAMMIF